MANIAEGFNLIDENLQTEAENHPLESLQSFDPEMATRQVESAKERISHIANNQEASLGVVIDNGYPVSENWRNGSHFMSKEENAEYGRLCSADLRKAIKYLREKWAEHVDRDFVQSFRCIHWVSNYDTIKHLEGMLDGGRHEEEISTQAYDSIEKLQNSGRWLDAKVGLLINGTVNLASNDDIQTKQWLGSLIDEDDGRKRRRYTVYANRLLTNEKNCISPYEFVVGDWVVEAIVADSNAITPELSALSKKYNTPIITTDDKRLFGE